MPSVFPNSSDTSPDHSVLSISNEKVDEIDNLKIDNCWLKIKIEKVYIKYHTLLIHTSTMLTPILVVHLGLQWAKLEFLIILLQNYLSLKKLSKYVYNY